MYSRHSTPEYRRASGRRVSEGDVWARTEGPRRCSGRIDPTTERRRAAEAVLPTMDGLMGARPHWQYQRRPRCRGVRHRLSSATHLARWQRASTRRPASSSRTSSSPRCPPTARSASTPPAMSTSSSTRPASCPKPRRPSSPRARPSASPTPGRGSAPTSTPVTPPPPPPVRHGVGVSYLPWSGRCAVHSMLFDDGV